jgi:hypothetical protein
MPLEAGCPARVVEFLEHVVRADDHDPDQRCRPAVAAIVLFRRDGEVGGIASMPLAGGFEVFSFNGWKLFKGDHGHRGLSIECSVLGALDTRASISSGLPLPCRMNCRFGLVGPGCEADAGLPCSTSV